MEQLALIHRSNTRRKACGGCVRTKRKCDLTIPSCARCIKKNLSCTYNTNVCGLAVLNAGDSSWSVDLSEDTSNPSVANSTELEIIDSLPNQTVIFPTEMQLSPQITETTLSFLPSNENNNPFQLDSYQSLYPTSFALPYPTTIDPLRLQQTITSLLQSIDTLVLTGGNSFIHPLLYSESLPQIYQDLVCVCSLYSRKTSKNSEMVWKILEGKRWELIKSIYMLHSTHEWVLAVQALVIYTFIIRFDEDIVLYHPIPDGELGMLESWTDKLQEMYWETEFEIAASSGPSYRQWVLLESIRRTVIVSVLVRCIDSHMRNGFTELVPLLEVLPVCPDAGKSWDEGGDDEVEQVVKWRGNAGLVSYLEFVNGFNEDGGRIDRVGGDYEVLLLRVCQHAEIRDGE